MKRTTGAIFHDGQLGTVTEELPELENNQVKGKCIMVFMDNHAEAVDYKTFMTWKPSRNVPSLFTADYYMFLRGFDASR